MWSGRDLLRQPLQPVLGRHHRRRPGPGHDHKRRLRSGHDQRGRRQRGRGRPDREPRPAGAGDASGPSGSVVTGAFATADGTATRDRIHGDHRQLDVRRRRHVAERDGLGPSDLVERRRDVLRQPSAPTGARSATPRVWARSSTTTVPTRAPSSRTARARVRVFDAPTRTPSPARILVVRGGGGLGHRATSVPWARAHRPPDGTTVLQTSTPGVPVRPAACAGELDELRRADQTVRVSSGDCTHELRSRRHLPRCGTTRRRSRSAPSTTPHEGSRFAPAETRPTLDNGNIYFWDAAERRWPRSRSRWGRRTCCAEHGDGPAANGVSGALTAARRTLRRADRQVRRARARRASASTHPLLKGCVRAGVETKKAGASAPCLFALGGVRAPSRAAASRYSEALHGARRDRGRLSRFDWWTSAGLRGAARRSPRGAGVGGSRDRPGPVEARLEWSGLPLNVGGFTIGFTIYPPLTVVLLLAIWLGPPWGMVPPSWTTFASALSVVSRHTSRPFSRWRRRSGVIPGARWSPSNLSRAAAWSDLRRFLSAGLIAASASSIAVLIWSGRAPDGAQPEPDASGRGGCGDLAQSPWWSRHPALRRTGHPGGTRPTLRDAAAPRV